MGQEKHLESLYSNFIHSAQEFDRQCLYIASGAFTLSFAFVKDIVVLNSAVEIWRLTYSWYCFASVVIVSLIGHYCSTFIHGIAIKHSDNKHFNKLIRPYNFVIHVINLISIVGILVGSFLLIFFINTNL